MISFRTRLFLIAASIVSAVLIVVMLFAWSRIMNSEVDRLEERLCRETQRLTTQAIVRENLLDLETDLVGRLRLSGHQQLLIRYVSTAGMPELKSTYWQDDFSIEKLNWKKSGFRNILGPERIPRDGRQLRQERASGLEDSQRDRNVRGGTCQLSAFDLNDNAWRAALFSTPRGKGFIAVDLAATKAEMQTAFQQASWLVVPLAFTLTALGAWLLASLTMKPVNRLRDAMRNLTKNELDQRLPSVGEDKEFRELICAYNIMMERLEMSFHQATRFSGDAAHEIRTPLTILQGKLEQAFNRTNDPALQADFTYMLDEVARLSAITRKLLMLSHADAGKLALHQSHINLTALLEELMEDLRMLSADCQLAAEITENQSVQGDAVLLQQVLNNLLSNAIRYCSPQGRISIQSSNDKDGVVVIICNTSAPITQEDRARFFERFYRGDPAHNRHIDGNGLGLSLALEIVKAHGGDLRLEVSEMDIVKIRLWLPNK